jgi:dihydroorotase
MQEYGLVLQLHGEMPSDAGCGLTVLNAESRFLPQVERIHAAFPDLRIVLEHVSTADAVAFVCDAGDWLAATVTPQHLSMTVDDWAGRNHHYCKPVAKTCEDRSAIREAVASAHPRFFLGSDSAPHPRADKECAIARPGVYSSPLLLSYLADVFEDMGCLEMLQGFACRLGAQFYGLPPAQGRVALSRCGEKVPGAIDDIIPFRAGESLRWCVQSVRLVEQAET